MTSAVRFVARGGEEDISDENRDDSDEHHGDYNRKNHTNPEHKTRNKCLMLFIVIALDNLQALLAMGLLWQRVTSDVNWQMAAFTS